jgi:hypothetical protein
MENKEYFRERYAANREELTAKAREYHALHRETQNSKCRDRATARRRANGGQSMEDNKSCNGYLGIVIAERVLSMVFTGVQRMPNGNKGFDFRCSQGFDVDVKSACVTKGKNGWIFQINRNKIADYFALLAFDNRQSLTPLHLWIMPGHVVNNNVSVHIAPSTLVKWSKYEHPLEKVVECCEALR